MEMVKDSKNPPTLSNLTSDCQDKIIEESPLGNITDVLHEPSYCNETYANAIVNANHNKEIEISDDDDEDDYFEEGPQTHISSQKIECIEICDDSDEEDNDKFTNCEQKINKHTTLDNNMDVDDTFKNIFQNSSLSDDFMQHTKSQSYGTKLDIGVTSGNGDSEETNSNEDRTKQIGNISQNSFLSEDFLQNDKNDDSSSEESFVLRIEESDSEEETHSCGIPNIQFESTEEKFIDNDIIKNFNHNSRETENVEKTTNNLEYENKCTNFEDDIKTQKGNLEAVVSENSVVYQKENEKFDISTAAIQSAENSFYTFRNIIKKSTKENSTSDSICKRNIDENSIGSGSAIVPDFSNVEAIHTKKSDELTGTVLFSEVKCPNVVNISECDTQKHCNKREIGDDRSFSHIKKKAETHFDNLKVMLKREEHSLRNATIDKPVLNSEPSCINRNKTEETENLDSYDNSISNTSNTITYTADASEISGKENDEVYVDTRMQHEHVGQKDCTNSCVTEDLIVNNDCIKNNDLICELKHDCGVTADINCHENLDRNLHKENMSKNVYVSEENGTKNTWVPSLDMEESVESNEFCQPDASSIHNENDNNNLEDIRESLKMQLSSLRTRKKNHILQPMMTKVVDGNLEFNKRNVLIEKDIFKDINKTVNNLSETPEFVLNHGQTDKTFEQINNYPFSEQDSNNLLHTSSGIVEKEESIGEEGNVFDEIRKIIRNKKEFCKPNNLAKNLEDLELNSNCESQQLACEKYNEIKILSHSTENSLSNVNIADNSSKRTISNSNTNSPFISNTLDEFLTENSKLNVSYKIPKSGAEKGLSNHYNNDEDRPVLVTKLEETRYESKIENKEPPKFKAKTLAEKRKLLERSRLKEERKLEKIRRRQEKEFSETGKVIKCNKSFVLYNNKKIWVKSTKPDHCFAVIGSSLKTFVPNLKKPSLLDHFKESIISKIKYKPGPLCKKVELQVDDEQWITEIKQLPKIGLEIIPEIGKPIAPQIIHRLPPHDGIITDSLIEFALSVVKSKNTTKKSIFKFNLKYDNHQENIFVRKQKQKFTIPKFQTGDKSLEDDVSDVISNLINYVVIKEMEPHLIKEDAQVTMDSDIGLKKPNQISENVSAIVKRQKKSKMNYELQRLNCKVVNVIIENEDFINNCQNAYCKLGCLCQSLRCETLIETHCKKLECMFECKCVRIKSSPIGEKFKLPLGADILSCDTVSRIEDRAKKDLAKVEKEFTQTIICTNDKTIVIGAGSRYKSRRSLKTPKKYSDNFEIFEDIIKKDKKHDETQKECTPCVVSLEKLNLSGIIPYCLQHQLYYCFCNGKESYVRDATTKTLCYSNESPVVINRLDMSEEVIYSSTGRPIRRKRLQTFDNDTVGVIEKRKKSSVLSEPKDEHETEIFRCQRTEPISYQYKKMKFDQQSIQNLTNYDFINNITESDLLKIKLNAKESMLSESDMLKFVLVSEKKMQLQLESNAKRIAINEKCTNLMDSQRHKRKQHLEVREDAECYTGVNVPHVAKHARSVFDGEVIVRDSEWLKKLGRKSVTDGYCRLLPYKCLIRAFYSKEVKIWCLKTDPFKLLMNKAQKEPPSKYIDINKATNRTNVINWILRNKLPDQYNEENLSFILVEVKNNFEIRGVCTQVFHSNKTAEESQPNNFQQNLKDNSDARTSNEIDLREDMSSSDLIELRHLDMDGSVRILLIRKQRIVLQELVAEECDNLEDVSVSSSNLYMWAALPEVYRMCKWRMIYLNRDFTYLYFKKIKYSIKYKDLVSTVELAKKEGCTLIVKNSKISSAYEHVLFALYFDPHFMDRIFIGPYFKTYIGDDIETLRYVNKSLVSSEAFNKLQGKMDYRCGHWLVERPYKRSTSVISKTIDLTKDTDDNSSNSFTSDILKSKSQDESLIENKFSSLENNATNDQQIIWHQNTPIYVRNCKPRTPDEFNRFIITNIPNFGYLGACERENGVIEVSWPFERKVLHFVNANAARDFLQDRFMQLLQPVPETFKIYVVVLTEIDFTAFKPIDSDFLNGRCVVGEFGIYNFQCMSDEFCLQTVKLSKSEITKLFARKAQDFLRKKVEELAELVDVHKDSQDYNIIAILERAKNEIRSLESTHMDYVRSVEILERSVVKKMTKLYGLIGELPQENRNVQSRTLSDTIKIRPNKFNSTEVIEISDSDEDFAISSFSNTKDEFKEVTQIQLDHKPKVIAKISPFFAPSNQHGRSLLKPTIAADQKVTPTTVKPQYMATTVGSTINNKFSILPPRLYRSEVVASEKRLRTVPSAASSTAIPFEEAPLDGSSATTSSSIETTTTNTTSGSQFPVLRVKPSTYLLSQSALNSNEGVEGRTSERKNIVANSGDLPNHIVTNTNVQQGIKLIKTVDGKLMLVSDKNKSTRVFKKISPSNSNLSQRIIIKNNKVISRR